MTKVYEKSGKMLKVTETYTNEGLITLNQLRGELKRLKAEKQEYLTRINALIDDKQALLNHAINLNVDEEIETVVE